MSLSQPQYQLKDRDEEDTYVLGKREKVREREQARERQRRKRARDKSASAVAAFLETHPNAELDSNECALALEESGSVKRESSGRGVDLDMLPPDEAARREKIRAAARERQRRHRAGVKAKRMAELGMAIVNTGGRVEQTAIGYTINENGQYEAVLADSSQNLGPPPPPYPIPHPHATPGQIFSSTLYLALSCAPLLKQHLLRLLRSTNEELAAFEPHIAAAFDHWDHNRTLYYASHGNQPLYEPEMAPYSRPYDMRNRPYQSSDLSSSKPHRDANESGSVSDDQNEEEQGDHLSEQTYSLPRDAQVISQEREDRWQERAENGHGQRDEQGLQRGAHKK